MNGAIRVLFAVLMMLAVLPASAEDLAAKARDPTAPLTQFQTRFDYVSSYHNLPDAEQARFVLQPVIPWNWGEQPHIARITLPYVFSAPDWGAISEDQAEQGTATAIPPNWTPTADKNGLGDTSIFDFMMFDAPWPGRSALGISAVLPTATDPALGSEKWSIGPAGGGVATYGDLTLGAIALMNFSFAGASDRDEVQALTIQPIMSYGMGEGWSLELSEISYNYDFDSNQWSTIPLGGRVAKVATLGKMTFRFYFDAEYNFVDDIVTPEWTYRFAVVPLIP